MDPVPTSIPTVITHEEVMFFDTDCGGVVHNLAYLRMIETARTRLTSRLGLSLREISEKQLFPALVRTEIDYHRPARLGDSLEIRGRLERVERVRFWCRFEMRRRHEDAVLVDCRQSVVLVQMPQGRPTRLPADWREKYGG